MDALTDSTHAQAIIIRKPVLAFDRPIQRFYFGNDPLRTHIFNALNLLFPEGERFFVKAVHDHVRDIEDGALKQDIRLFAGQEGQHANQHERFFAVMRTHGYRIDRFLARYKTASRTSGKWVPRWLRLAITAGAEHYTATMAAAVLDMELLQDCDPTMRDLITWHAVEEIEHKHVAHDVFIKMHPHNYPLRILGFIIATIAIAVRAAIAFRFLVKQDMAAGHLTQDDLAHSRAEWKRGDGARFQRRVFASMRQYFKLGFHPSQNDDLALLQRYSPTVVVS